MQQEFGLEGPLPGKLLRETRTGRNLTIEQVADDLCLTPQQVEAMEKDNYSYLPGATYVRGYLRNYARLLGLPEDKVLSTASIPTAVKTPGTGNRKAVMAVENTRNKSVAFLTAVIVAMLLGLIYSWWQTRETPEPGTLAANNHEQIAENSNQTAAAAAGSAETPQFSSMPSATPLAGAGEPVTPAATEDVIPEQAAGGSTADTDTAADPAQGSDVQASTEPATVSVSSADGSNLVLNFSADSWVDIQDASGNTLIRRTVPAGEAIAFKGTPPFKVFLGYAKGVKVNYRARDYDVTPHISGAIARFTLK